MTTQVEKTVEIDLPLPEVYALWNDFEKFPHFMDGVESVAITGPNSMHWKASVLGVHREWDAEVTDLVENEKIAWRSVSGTDNAGQVTFAPLETGATLVKLNLTFEPEGTLETIADKLGFTGDIAEGDLGRFKKYVEDLPASERLDTAGVAPDAYASAEGVSAGLNSPGVFTGDEAGDSATHSPGTVRPL